MFGGLFKLWHSDRKTAEAVLLHEAAHCRHGDVLVVGAVSFFEALVKNFTYIFNLFMDNFPTDTSTNYNASMGCKNPIEWFSLDILQIVISNRVVLEKDEEVGGYTINCPSLPDCFSQGDTTEEALENNKEAIQACLESLAEDEIKSYLTNPGLNNQL